MPIPMITSRAACYAVYDAMRPMTQCTNIIIAYGGSESPKQGLKRAQTPESKRTSTSHVTSRGGVHAWPAYPNCETPLTIGSSTCLARLSSSSRLVKSMGVPIPITPPRSVAPANLPSEQPSVSRASQPIQCRLNWLDRNNG